MVINIVQNGSAVQSTATGTFNIDGLVPTNARNSTFLGSVGVGGASGFVDVGMAGFTNIAYVSNYSGLVGPASFGTSGNTFASTSSGDDVGIVAMRGQLTLPQDYISGSLLSGSAIFNNQTLAGLGLTTGQYVYTLGLDSVVVNIGPAFTAVPEPATWALMILGFGAVGVVARRRRSPRHLTVAA